jgi:nitrate reductase gamma subunit
MNGLVFYVLPYFTLLIFIVGLIYRFWVWKKLPQPGFMTLFPAPSKGSGTFTGVVKESLFFPNLFRGDKSLWLMAWIFHASLALIIVGHFRVFTALFDSMMISMGINVNTLSSVSGGLAGVIIFATALLLLLRRLFLTRVREITNFIDYLAIVLILIIVITGDLMRFGAHFDLAITRAYFTGLFTFSLSSAIIPQSSMFMWHFFFVQLLMIYVPFSKLLHFGGIFFTQTAIQKS